MVTVEKLVIDYCNRIGLPAPTSDDLMNLGAIIGHHFRNYWAPAKYGKLVSSSETVIIDAGFVFNRENLVVNAYPLDFVPDMENRAEIYFHNKALVQERSGASKRKRIPVKYKKSQENGNR